MEHYVTDGSSILEQEDLTPYVKFKIKELIQIGLRPEDIQKWFKAYLSSDIVEALITISINEELVNTDNR